MAPKSALPTVYYVLFGVYEPMLSLVSMVGAFIDPKTAHDSQASWPKGAPPADPLPLATLLTILQLANVCGILGFVNIFVLSAARKHLSAYPVLQEKVVGSLLTALLIGDISHIGVTFWGLGEQRWSPLEWGQMTWCVIGSGLSLLIPRFCWWMGVGRFVRERDEPHPEKRQ